MKADIYERITNRIAAELEQGARPRHKPWSAEHTAGWITRLLRFNSMPYQGSNVLMLWGEAVAKGYAAPIWMTFKPALELGGHVRKGEHGSLVVYADRIRRTELDADTGEEAEREIPFLKGYTVFNVKQVEGLPAHFYAVAEPRLDPVQCNARADEFFAATRADVRHGGDRAYYTMAEDRAQMPPFESFRDAESYIAASSPTKHKAKTQRRRPTKAASPRHPQRRPPPGSLLSPRQSADALRKRAQAVGNSLAIRDGTCFTPITAPCVDGGNIANGESFSQ